ncbi:MAG: hypothetical protein R3296_09920 [Oleiphilaceae bacterium]|nr:hypothetical protein [Oleiphilaceae bacterium]
MAGLLTTLHNRSGLAGPSAIHLLVLLLILTQSGCRNDELDEVTERPNSFSGSQHNPDRFRDQGTGLGGGGDLAVNEVRVRLQRPSGDSRADHRGLAEAEDFSLRVLRVGPGLAPLETLHPARERDGNSVILRFPEGSPVPMDINLIVEAWSGGQAYRAPLATDNRLVRVNPFSDYLVRKGVAPLSGGEISELNSCRRTLCPLELIWPSLATQVQAFNIDLSGHESPEQALEQLSQRADFDGFVSRSVALLRLDPSAISSLDEAVDSENFRFNSQFFAMDLNEHRGEAGDGGLWVSRSSVRSSTRNSAGTGFSHPTLSLASFRLDLLDLSITTIGSVIPFRSRALDQDLQFPGERPVNEHATVPRSAFSRNGHFLSGGRPLFQTVRSDGTVPMGRTLDPYLLDGRIIGEQSTPQALLSGHFHAGRGIALSRNSRGELERDQLREVLHSAALQVHLRQSPDGDFSLGRLHPRYNLLGFRVRLGSGETPIQVESQIGAWSDLSGGETLRAGRQSSGNIRRLQRHGDGTVSLDPGNEETLTRTIDIRPIEQLRDDLGEGSGDYRGHLFLRSSARNHGDPGQDGPNGAASPNGDWLAFTPVSDDGSHALWLATAPPQGLNSLRGLYQLQGFAMAMSEKSNRLKAFSGACLELGDSGGPARLHPAGLQVHHDIARRRVAPPAALPRSTRSGGITGPDEQGLVQIRLEGEAPSQPLRLEGFAAPGGEALILRLEEGHSLGPVLALRDPDCQGLRAPE